MTPGKINRNLHKACLIAMEASLLEQPEIWREKKARDVIECINFALKDVDETDLGALGNHGMTMYGWLFKQRAELAESLVSGLDIDSFLDDVEQFAND